MSHEITLDGSVYVSSKRAAEIAGYAQDYVGQLARSGKIDARRVGGLWYIKHDSLLQHKEKADAYVPTPPQKTKAEFKSTLGESFIGDDGMTYVSASRGAEISGYNQDYIGQLARESKIPSHQVGNRWYVGLEELKRHKKEKDALLAAVQADSVGIQKPLVSQDVEEEQEPEDVDLHFNYRPESVQDPFATTGAMRERRTEYVEAQEDEEITENEPEEDTVIPIRVVRAVSPTRINPERNPRKNPLSGISSKFIVIPGLILIVVVLLFLNRGTVVSIARGVLDGSTIFAKEIHYQRSR
jgi:hypothetical protein